MTRDDAVAIIQEQLGFRTDLSSNIVTNLQLAQTMLEKGPTKPWWLVSEDSYIRLTVNEQRLILPSDFLQETDQAVLRYVPDDLTASAEVDLKKDDYDQLRKAYLDTDTGTIETGAPEAYALLGEYFRIFPTPDDTYLIHQIYFKTDTVLDTDVTNGWLTHAPYLLIGKAGWQIAMALRDQSAAAAFRQMEQEGRLILASQTYDREFSNRDMQMGGPH
jgi:hypothetical protein